MGLFTRLGALSLCFAPLLLVGCGDATISGTVKFPDGTPLTKGAVVFTGATTELTAGINSDGSYTATSASGIPSETYKVSVTGPIFGPDEDAQASGADAGEAEELYLEDVADDAGEALVARKFSSGDTSGLTYTGGAGKYDVVVDKP